MVSRIDILFLLFKSTLVICLHVVLFKPLMGPYQMLPFQVRVDLGLMAMKGYFIIPKARYPPSDCLVSPSWHSLGGVSYSSPVHVFYNPSWLGNYYHYSLKGNILWPNFQWWVVSICRNFMDAYLVSKSD